MLFHSINKFILCLIHSFQDGTPRPSKMARTQMADEHQTAKQEVEEVSEDFGIVKLLKMVIRFGGQYVFSFINRKYKLSKGSFVSTKHMTSSDNLMSQVDCS